MINIDSIKEKLYSGIICDVMDGLGYRHQSLSNKIMPLEDETVIFGPAFTCIANEVYSMPEDPLTAQTKVVGQLGEGEIMVLTTRGEMNCAVFGDIFAAAVKNRKSPGVLLNAYARDIKALKAMHYPIFYTGTNPNTSKGRTEINECQLPIKIDGVTINPGDYIYGDIDGICVIPQNIAEEVFKKCKKTLDDEDTVREALDTGMSIEEAYRINGAI